MKWFINGFFEVKFILWVAVIGAAVYFGPDLFYGFTARFDYIIGYDQ